MSSTIRSRRPVFLGVGVAVVLAVAAAGWFLFLRSDAAPEANIEDAAAAAQGDQAPPADAATDGNQDADEEVSETPDPADVTGTWTVVAGDPASIDSGTFVGYRVQEELRGIGDTTATGRTPAVTGELVIDGSQVTTVAIQADLTQLTSDEAFRDGAIRERGIETDTFPTATFTTTAPIELPDEATDGEAFTITATGDLTLHGVTQPVAWELDAQLVGDTIVIVGQLPIVMSDYDITPPQAGPVLAISDEGIAEIQLRLARS